jgi:hypothetical protein
MSIEAEFGPDFTRELHGLAAVVVLADRMADRENGMVAIPETWWREYVMAAIDNLNEIARAKKEVAHGTINKRGVAV